MMQQKCDTCGDWLEYTDTDNGYDIYVCIGCGREYKFRLPIELKYAPRQCRYFCLGDCTLTGGSGQEMKSCHTDYPECERSERK